MARKLRVEFEGAIYHVTVRGVERRRLFDDDADRERFVERLGQAREEYGVRVYLFCLMGNHIHLVVETPRGNLSAFMHKLQTAYTVYYNRRHRRAGHLVQGRFGAVPVQGDEYLLRLSRYVHLNPVFAGGWKRAERSERIRGLRAYRWSSYRGYAGLGQRFKFVEEGPILAMVGGPVAKRRKGYRRFVELGLARGDGEFRALLREARWGVGDASFQERIRERHADEAGKARRPEDVAFRRVTPRRDGASVLGAVAHAFGLDPGALRRRRYGCVARAVAARLLGQYAGMNQRDIAGFLRMGSGAAVCLQLRRLRERLVEDAALAKQVARLSATLQADDVPARRE